MNKMSAGIFITGTDTGVGKTYVAVRIAEGLRRHGADVGVMKPAETGCIRRAGELVPADTLRLMKAAGSLDALGHVNPYRFRRPPSVAAGLDGSRIEPAKILRSFRHLSKKHEFMIVEGAGGILVPLSDLYSYLDLAKDLRLPALIVARPGLGTVNHTLLTIGVLKSRYVPITGIVINHTEDKSTGSAERTNPAVIERISGVPILGIVPYGASALGEIVDRIIGPPASYRGTGT